MSENLASLIVAILVGTAVLLSFGRWVGRVRFSLSNAFWCSLIGHVFPAVVAVALGFLLRNYLLAAFLIYLPIAWLFQIIVFQIFARTQNEILVGWRAGVLAVIVSLPPRLRSIFRELYLCLPCSTAMRQVQRQLWQRIE